MGGHIAAQDDGSEVRSAALGQLSGEGSVRLQGFTQCYQALVAPPS